MLGKENEGLWFVEFFYYYRKNYLVVNYKIFNRLSRKNVVMYLVR